MPRSFKVTSCDLDSAFPVALVNVHRRQPLDLLLLVGPGGSVNVLAGRWVTVAKDKIRQTRPSDSWGNVGGQANNNAG
jgi:hypothetical protein